MFTHLNLNLPKLDRETIDGVRYYKVPENETLLELVSITSVISNYNKQIFINWRKRVGEEKAQRITNRSTCRGTGMHTLIEYYLNNEPVLPDAQPLPKLLFKICRPKLNNINNIYGLEVALYSKILGIAGTVDCIAEYNGELAIIDFKSSKEIKEKKWIEHYFVQCAAYACMLYELTGITVKKFVIIMSCEYGDCVVYEEYDKEKYMKLLVKYIKKFVNDKLKFHESKQKLK